MNKALEQAKLLAEKSERDCQIAKKELIATLWGMLWGILSGVVMGYSLFLILNH